MSEGHFEAKLHAYRRTQEGAVISFVIHPDEIKKITDLSASPFGSRYVIGYAEIGDDEKPIEVAASSNGKTPDFESGNSRSNRDAATKPKRKFSELSLPEQAGIRCADSQFSSFLYFIKPKWGGLDAAQVVRRMCEVTSRSELSTNQEAAEKWRALESSYQNWLTTQQYSESVRR